MVTSKPQQTSSNFGFSQAIRSSIFSAVYSSVSDVSIPVPIVLVYRKMIRRRGAPAGFLMDYTPALRRKSGSLP